MVESELVGPNQGGQLKVGRWIGEANDGDTLLFLGIIKKARKNKQDLRFTFREVGGRWEKCMEYKQFLSFSLLRPTQHFCSGDHTDEC